MADFALDAGTTQMLGQAGGQLMAPQKDPGMISGVTEANRQEAIDWGLGFMKDELGFQGATSKGTGFDLTGSRKNKGQKEKAAAAMAFLMEVRGLSEEEAQAKVDKIISNPNKVFQDLKGFKKWIAQGGGAQYGVAIGKSGGIVPLEKYKGPQYQESQTGMRDALNQANLAGLGTVNSLMPYLAQDLGQATAFKGGLRGMMMSDLAEQDTEGLTQQQRDALEMSKQYALRDYAGTFNDNVKNVIGRLQGSGALRSSLIGDNLRRGAFDSYGKFLQGLEASQAGQEQQYLNDAANRSAQRMSNLVTAFGAGGAGQLAQLTNPYANPASLGLATDPEQAQIILNKQALEQKGRAQAGSFLQDSYTTATLQPNSAPKDKSGMWGSIGSVAGGIAGAAFGNPMLGAQLGGAIGRYAGSR